MDPVEPSLKINIADLVDTRTLSEVFDSFHRLFKIPLRLFDLDGNLLLEKSEDAPTCSYLNTLPTARNRCLVIRQRVKATRPASEKNAFSTVTCFSGLEYLVIPVVFQSELLGKLVLGPYLPKQLEKIPHEIIEIEPNVDTGQLKAAFSELPRISESKRNTYGTALATTLDSIFFATHKAHVTNQMHLATVRESYRELTDKNRRLEEMAEERKEFDRRKSNFLAMVSHELRTPLTSIIGYSDMLTEGIAGELAEEQKQFIQTIKAKGDELLKLISSILDFSQIDSGRLSVQATPTNVADFIEKAISDNKETADRRGVKLAISIPADLPTVQLDLEKIVIALSHLIDNGIKFSPPGGVVKVSAHIVASNENDASDDGFGFVLMAAPDMLEISVEDYGVGIADQEQANIFAPFTQIDESSTREHGGAGLGLAIVKQYVEAHGGRVHVRSRKGEGSNFSIRIPIINTPQ